MKREYIAELIVTTCHYFTVLARSPEDAVAEAENLLEDGETGTIISRDIETADAYPVEDSFSMSDEVREDEYEDDDE